MKGNIFQTVKEMYEHTQIETWIYYKQYIK